MHDLSFFRANLDAVAQRLATRGYQLDVEQFRALDAERRAALTEAEQLKAQRNEKSAHEPRVVRADDWKPHAHHTHAHGATDGHGSHLHRSSRPWMIGH